MKLSLIELKDPGEKALLLYTIAKDNKEREYWANYNPDQLVKDLEKHDKYLSVVDENNRCYGGFICEKSWFHVYISNKARGKWGFLLKKVITPILDKYKEVNIHISKDNNYVGNTKLHNNSLYKHLKKRYGMKKSKETNNKVYYKIERIV